MEDWGGRGDEGEGEGTYGSGDDWREDDYWENDQQEDKQENNETSNPNQTQSQQAAEETTTPMSSSSPEVENEMTVSEREAKNFGWKTIDFGGKALKGAAMLMQDGDQQILNPFGYTSGAWTVYSFRPLDRDKDNCPQIAITPASFESIKSMETMLNNVPYVVVKEYFFKNTASTMIDFVKKIYLTLVK